MKLGLIRCLQTESMCPATGCFKAMRDPSGAFAGIEEELVLVGVSTCGGCPGKNAVPRAAQMVKNGAEAIVLASCISKGSPVGMPCPHFAEMKQAIQKRIGAEGPMFDYTHN